MTRNTLELLVVVAANVLGAAMSLPQALRLVRTRVIDGVSLGWALLSVTANAWWVAYGVALDRWAIVPVALASVIGYSVVAVALLAFGERSVGRSALAAVAGMALVPVAGLSAGGWTTAGVVLGALYGVQLSPAVLAVLRQSDLSGVAVGTWVFAFTEAVLWGVYGVGWGDQGVIVLAVVGVLMSGVVLARLWAWHGTGRPAPAGALALGR